MKDEYNGVEGGYRSCPGYEICEQCNSRAYDNIHGQCFNCGYEGAYLYGDHREDQEDPNNRDGDDDSNY